MSIELNGTTKIRASELNDQTISVLQPKNWIINGGFDVWQRGTSQTTEGYLSADRWYYSPSGATGSISRQIFTIGQTEVPNNPKYYIRLQSTVANDQTRIEQHIEDITKFSGKTISISFWIKSDISRTVQIRLVNVYGSGGSPIDVIELFETTRTTWSRITKTFTVPSVSGKTIGNDHYLRVDISNPNFETFTFDIANVSLVEGSVPVEWQTEAYADVLRQCQRYYLKTTDLVQSGYSMVANATTSIVGCINFPVPFRIKPNLTNIILRSNYDGQVAVVNTFYIQNDVYGVNSIYALTFVSGSINIGHWQVLSFEASAEL